jgi:hypothetical protein
MVLFLFASGNINQTKKNYLARFFLERNERSQYYMQEDLGHLSNVPPQ